MKTLLMSALLILSLNGHGQEDSNYEKYMSLKEITNTEIMSSMNKGVCENVCNYVCNNKYCEMINGEEVCKEDCRTVCEYVCE